MNNKIPLHHLRALETRMQWLERRLPHQVPPPEDDPWDVWWLNAGRGSGKTRTASEETWWYAYRYPKSRTLVLAPTANDIRATCFEGESGLINVMPHELISSYNKSTHELVLKNGSQIRGISGDAYERLRGPQFGNAWVDELGAFEYQQQAYDMMKFGLRLGIHPRVMITTTPKPSSLLIQLKRQAELGKGDIIITQASTFDNLDNLAPTFANSLLQYEGTQLGEQELYAEIIEEYNAFFPLSDFKLWSQTNGYPELIYVVNAVDAATSDKDYNDYSAICTIGVFRHPENNRTCAIVLDISRGHWQYPELREKIIEKSKLKFTCKDPFTGEQLAKGVDITLVENASSGIAVAQDLARARIRIAARKTGSLNKIERASLVTPLVAHGYIYLIQTAERGDDGEYIKKPHPNYYKQGWIDEICLFPNQPMETGLIGASAERKEPYDDQIDAFTIALAHLKARNMLNIDYHPARMRFADDEMVVKNPYMV